MRRRFIRCVLFLVLVILPFSGCDMFLNYIDLGDEGNDQEITTEEPDVENPDVDDPDTDDPEIIIGSKGIEAIMNHEDIISADMDEDVFFFEYNDGMPSFSVSDENGEEYYISLSELDELGRVGVAMGLFDAEHCPDYERGDLSTKPSGWVQNDYSWVESRWLYNRSHMLGFQYSGLQDDERNLMTGTRSFNVKGMLPYENILTDHIKEEDGSAGDDPHRVLVRVTPDFYEDNLLAHGIIMEADCLECDDIDFAVYIPNWEPGVTIDYRSGDNWANSDLPPEEEVEIPLEDATYILNTNSDVFHSLTCSRAPEPDSENYKLTDKSREALIEGGYDPCGICKP